jgi:hypothetical protein
MMDQNDRSEAGNCDQNMVNVIKRKEKFGK